MIIPQEKPQDMYISFLTKILETLKEFWQIFFSGNPETFVKEFFFQSVCFSSKKSFLQLECRFDNLDENPSKMTANLLVIQNNLQNQTFFHNLSH